MRNKKADKPVLLHANDFPAMNHVIQKQAVFANKFAALAKDWHAQDEQTKKDEEIRRTAIEKEEKAYSMPVSMNNLYRIRGEIEREESPEADVAFTPDEWVAVKARRKPKREKTLEEIIAAEEAEIAQEKEDSMWIDDVPTHETYWDQKY